MTSSSTTIGGSGTSVSNIPADTMSASTLGGTSASDLQSTFLQLLVTQLKNQDPTNPVDSSQMTSQLAQISTVSGIAQMNASLSSLSSQLTASQQTQAAQLIGQDVLAPGNSVTVKSGAASVFGVQLPAAATNVTITVKNAAGTVVDTINAGAQPAGNVPLDWTPTDSAGNPLPDGTYTASASYVNGAGASNSATVLSSAQVQGVIQQADGTPGLMLSNGKTVGLSQVASIYPGAATSRTASSN